MKTTNFDIVKTDKGWRAVHRPSGLGIPVDYHLRQDALDVALDLEAIGDWSLAETEYDLLKAAARVVMERAHP